MRVLGSVASRRTRKAIGLSHEGSPGLTIYPFAFGFGTKYANAAVALSGSGRDLAWDKAGRSLVAPGGTSPFVAGYQWFEGFSTKELKCFSKFFYRGVVRTFAFTIVIFIY